MNYLMLMPNTKILLLVPADRLSNIIVIFISGFWRPVRQENRSPLPNGSAGSESSSLDAVNNCSNMAPGSGHTN